MKHGKGKYYYKKSGELYIGEWQENKRNGFGKFFEANGDRYVGFWYDNMR